MHPKHPLSRTGNLYVAFVIGAGLAVTAYSGFDLIVHPVSNQWLILAGLTLLTGSFSVKVPSIAARISVSDAFVFASVLLFGPAPATVIVAFDCFVISLSLSDASRSPTRSLFNLSAVALAIWLASQMFFWLAGVRPGDLGHLLPLENHLWQLFALAASYFLLNTWLVAVALAFEKRANVIVLWWENFLWFSLNYFSGVSVAALLVSYTHSVDLSAIGIILPLLLITYLTHRTSLGRIEDSKRHVEQLGDLYLSTIETLAMAVDAKDQITHGHIRRVQIYALELAKLLGVRDEGELKAIEAAALLHDVGKLAIPEHILNKPGKLTASEFEKMKRHAAIGADLISAIRFPYPVVPIVRHHHEQWDGKGYPAGISGPDIPLGARILSVVDCFDALMSDRPYRPRMTAEDALATLGERRGTMHDPLIVDVFVQAYPVLAPIAIAAGHQVKSIPEIHLESGYAPEEQLRSVIRAAQSTSLDPLRRELQRATSTRQVLQACSQYLRQLTPGVVYALYRPSEDSDVLVCTDAVGDENGLLIGLRIRKGERITGWCAANDRTITNSNASLDLGSLSELFQAKLIYAMSTPLHHKARLMGVLTTYSTDKGTFSPDHRYAFEQVASAFGDRLGASTHFSGATVIQLTSQLRH